MPLVLSLVIFCIPVAYSVFYRYATQFFYTVKPNNSKTNTAFGFECTIYVYICMHVCVRLPLRIHLLFFFILRLRYAVVLNARCGLSWNYHSLPQCADANNSLLRPNDHSISSLPSPEATIYLSTVATAAASVSLVLRNVTKHDRRTFADSTDRGTRRCAFLSIYCRFHFQSRCRRNRLLNEESLQRSTFPSSIVC